MNPICKFCLDGSCRSSNKCVNRYGKLSCTTRQQVRQTTTTESTFKPTTAVAQDEKYLLKSNKLKKTKSIKEQPEQDLKAIRLARLTRETVTLRKSISTLLKQLKKENNKNTKLTKKFNIALLDNDDYQCVICLHVFIRPTLLGCSHMFCELCIDKWLKENRQCPICRVLVFTRIHCLNMDNLIQKRMQLMPAKIRLEYKNLKKARDAQKPTSIQIQPRLDHWSF